MLRKPLLTLGLMALSFPAALCAQEHSLHLSPGEVRISSHPYQPQFATLHSEARLVEVEVVVRDSRGKSVKGLTRDDFELRDSGKRRDLTAFSVDSVTNASSASPVQPGIESSVRALPEPASPERPETASAGRSIALLFDDVNTPSGDLARAKIAASRFIKEELSATDRVGVFDTSAGEVSPFTSDTTLLRGVIAGLESHPRASAGGMGSCPRITPYQAYRISNGDSGALQAAVLEDCKCPGHDGTQCLDIDNTPSFELSASMSGGGNASGSNGNGYLPQMDAIISEVKTQASSTWLQTKLVSDSTFAAIRACLQSVANTPGKRVLLIATSGFISGDLGPEEDAIIHQALRASVVINALDAKGLYAESPTRPLKEGSESTELHPLSMLDEARSLGERLESQDAAMARLAESTGGLFFRNNNDLNLGFYRLGVIPEVTYRLAFPPAEDGKYHQLKVEVKNTGSDFIQARPGYFAPSHAAAEQPDQRDALEHAVMGSEESHYVASGMTLQVAKAGESGRRLSLNIRIDAKRLPFQRQKDLRVERLTFVAALYDVQGAFIIGKEGEMNLALRPASYEQLADSGITGSLSLEAPPGAYSLRAVIQEGVQGKITAETRKIRID
jgi:VWFA-related protein